MLGYLTEYLKSQEELIRVYGELSDQYNKRNQYNQAFMDLIDWVEESRWRSWRYLPMILKVNRAYLDAYHPEWKDEDEKDDQEASGTT